MGFSTATDASTRMNSHLPTQPLFSQVWQKMRARPAWHFCFGLCSLRRDGIVQIKNVNIVVREIPEKITNYD